MTDLGYIGTPIVTDWNALAQDALNYLIANVPGFVPAEGHLTTWTIAAVARLVAQARDVASRVPFDIFRTFGNSLVGVPPLAGAYATVPVTFTVQDNAGYTVPASTLVGWAATGSNLIGFRTVAAIVIPPGSTTGGGTAQAADLGAGGNGWGPGPMSAIDPLAFVTAVQATAASSGGADAETTLAYLNRLSDTFQTLAPRPIVAGDFAILARSVAGVTRAVAVDGYNPTDGSTGNQRMVTVVGVDALGNALSTTVKNAVAALLQASREVNFVVNVADPTYTPVSVDFQVAVTPGADPVVTKTAVITAISNYLSPATFAGGGLTPPAWLAGETTVRYLDLAAVIANQFGVAHVTRLSINGLSGDATLAGVAPLPTVGTITGIAL